MSHYYQFALFFISSMLTLVRGRIRRAAIRNCAGGSSSSTGSTSNSSSSSSSSSSSEYASTLQDLFKAVKSAPRHAAPTTTATAAAATTAAATSADDLFRTRKRFFQGVYGEAKLSESRTQVVHVAGSKGKGSVVEYISSSLYAKGHKVGVFTSPHLHTARERIKVDRNLISRDDLTRLGKSALASMNDLPWTVFFDLLLTTAIRYFGEQQVDYLVLEAGIGGRYDSTNFLDAPSVGVITSISLDHQALLGDTIEAIAYQKAGIIKPRMNIFTPSTQPPSVLEVFRKQCALVNATLHEVPIARDRLYHLDLQTPYDVQVQNACLALAVVQHLGASPEGLKSFYWPCRMETFEIAQAEPPSSSSSSSSSSSTSSSSSSSTSNSVTIVLDGCHNGESVRLFLEGLRARYPDRQIVVHFGAGQEKALDDMLNQLALLSAMDSVVMVQSRHFKALSERELVDLAKAIPSLQPRLAQMGTGGAAAAGAGAGERTELGTVSVRLQEAIRAANNGKRPVIAVCGSLFAASEAREFLYQLQPKLFSADDWVRECD